MEAARPRLVSSLELDAAELMRAHPPIWQDRNKQLVASQSCPPNAQHRGRVRMTRWRAGALPEVIERSAPALDARAGVFDYAPAPAGEVHWHLNFADRRLFVAYGSGLLAQDELQVAEHPALGAIAEAMSALPAHRPLTFDDGDPTPVLIKGVERRCVLDTGPDLDAGRVYGLYGNRFYRAQPREVHSALTILEPPSVSNILAIEAPTGFRGAYTDAQIRLVLRTAVAGFTAARAESGPGQLVVHTGFWGCGAYGGNREFMAALQILAARMGAVDRLVFHTFDSEGMARYRAGEALATALATVETLEALIPALATCGYEWGVSDGN